MFVELIETFLMHFYYGFMDFAVLLKPTKLDAHINNLGHVLLIRKCNVEGILMISVNDGENNQPNR